MNSNLLLVLSLLTIWTSCDGQPIGQKNNAKQLSEQWVQGDTVQALGSSIMVVYQDSRDIYWFGSWETGVYRYDGKALIHYTTEHGLAQNRVDEIKEDTSGNIYFTSCHPTSTITKFDGQSFTNVIVTPSNDWKLEPNDLWFRHAYGAEKVYRFDGNTFYELTLPKPPTLPNPYEIYSIYKDIKGNIWFGTNPVGVCRYDGKTFEWITEEDVTEFRDEGANGVRSIVEDGNGDFWFNTEYRYGVYDSLTLNSNKFYTRHESIGSLDGKDTRGLNEFLSVAKDNQDNLWFATYLSGVWKYNGSQVTHYPVRLNGNDITLFSIYKDNHGDLWLGTHENGAFKFNGMTFEKFTP